MKIFRDPHFTSCFIFRFGIIDIMLAIEKIKKLKRDHLPQITLVTGEDLGQFAVMKQALLQAIAYDPADLTYSYFDLAETDYSLIDMDLQSLPFFADQKVVILDHVLDLTNQKKSYLSDNEVKQFETYLEQPVETTRLLIFAPGKLDGKRRLVKLLKRDAMIFEAEALKEAELKTYFQKLAHEKGLVFETGAFDTLLIKSNFDFSELEKNLVFLESYKSSGQISQQDISEAIPKTLQDNLFDLIHFVLTKKVDQAKDLVKDLVLQGEDEVKLLSILIGQFRLFLQTKLLLQKGQSENQIVKELSDYLGRRVNPYQVRFAIRDSRALSVDFLKKSLLLLIETDRDIKTGRLEKGYLFEVALLKIMSIL